MPPGYFLCLHFIFKILIIFTIITLNPFSGRLPISSSFFWSCGFVSCSFICYMFLCLSILFNLLCLESSFCRLEGCSSSWLWGVAPWVGLDQCHMQVSWLGGLVPIFLWLEWDLVSLKGSAISSSVFWGVYGFSMALSSLSTNGQDCVSILLMVWCEASVTGGF